jgi:hypothetical protein
MKSWQLLSVAVPALVLLLTGCDDSKNPLSDPQTSKADERLFGLWRERSDDGEVYYHVGRAGGDFPSGVMRIVGIKHTKGMVEPPEEYLAFPTVLNGKNYLNMVLEGDKKQVRLLNEKGWKSDLVNSYTFLRYQVDGDKLTVWVIDEDAKKKGIKDGKIKGVEEPNRPAKFTDTTENVARFVTAAGDSLWNTKEPGHFERVKVSKKR